jgi:hypothetical protein
MSCYQYLQNILKLSSNYCLKQILSFWNISLIVLENVII